MDSKDLVQSAQKSRETNGFPNVLLDSDEEVPASKAALKLKKKMSKSVYTR